MYQMPEIISSTGFMPYLLPIPSNFHMLYEVPPSRTSKMSSRSDRVLVRHKWKLTENFWGGFNIKALYHLWPGIRDTNKRQ
jgi:hypothetical protein